MILMIILKVSAPPSFIQSLGPYTGFTAASTNVSLLCQVCHDCLHGFHVHVPIVLPLVTYQFQLYQLCYQFYVTNVSLLCQVCHDCHHGHDDHEEHDHHDYLPLTIEH